MFRRATWISCAVLLSALTNARAASPTKTAAKPAAKSEAPAKAEAPAKVEHAIAEPEYVGIPFRVDPSDKSLQKLERQTYAVHAKAKALGFGGSRASYEVTGSASPVRFPAGQAMTFVIKLSSKDVDPSSVLKLVPLQTGAAGKKHAPSGVRQAVWMDQHGAFGNVNVDPTMGALPILAKPYGSSSVQFKPDADLAPGEYAILMPNSMTAYCFGLDAK